MKKTLLTLLLAVASLGTFAQGNYLQNPLYGANEAERTENAKLLNAFAFSYKLKDLPQAAFELHLLLDRVPGVSENLYIRGIEIYKDFYANAKDDARRKLCLDSMMTMFDMRAENFANNEKRGRDYVLAQKALTYSSYSEDQKVIADLFVKAIDAGLDVIDDTDVELIGTYFKNLTDSFTYEEVTADEYINRYEYICKALDNHNNESSLQIRGDIEAMFAASGAANCENIEKIFKPQYEADPNNAELVKKILGLFNRAKCSTPFQMELLEKYYQNDPQPEIALMLAGVYEEKKDHAKSIEYLNVAINSEKDPALKVSYLVRASNQTLQSGNGREASNFARRALDIEPNNALASFLHANAMLTGLNGCSGDAKQFACWIVADAFAQALKLMNADDPMRADAQAAYSNLVSNFPKQADLFMQGLEEGSGYTVNCGWVAGRTTVRGR